MISPILPKRIIKTYVIDRSIMMYSSEIHETEREEGKVV